MLRQLQADSVVHEGMRECHARGLMPVVLVAFDRRGQPFIIPLGDCTPEATAAVLGRIVNLYRVGVFDEQDAIADEPGGN